MKKVIHNQPGINGDTAETLTLLRQHIRRILDDGRLSAKEIAIRAQVSSSYITKFLQGSINGSIPGLDRLLLATGTTSALLRGSPAHPASHADRRDEVPIIRLGDALMANARPLGTLSIGDLGKDRKTEPTDPRRALWTRFIALDVNTTTAQLEGQDDVCHGDRIIIDRFYDTIPHHPVSPIPVYALLPRDNPTSRLHLHQVQRIQTHIVLRRERATPEYAIAQNSFPYTVLGAIAAIIRIQPAR